MFPAPIRPGDKMPANYDSKAVAGDSILRKRVVGITIEPTLSGFG
jgi:hypothetical protein